MKKITALLLCFLTVLNPCTGAFAMADSADCACVINASTGAVVFSKNIAKTHAMASTTKIMTAIVAMDNCPFDDIVTVSANAARQEGSSAYIKENMQLYMGDLLYGLMLNSGNDAAVAIAEHVAGSVDSFVDMMNRTAGEIGAKNTNFVNPNGLPDDTHFTTAADLALITRRAMKIPAFRDIVGTAVYQAKPLNDEQILYFSNHNKLLGMYEGVTGVKTGYTDAAGRCLVSAAMRDNMEFIAVTLGDPDDWDDHMEMLDYAFSTHYPKKVIEEGMTVRVAKIDGRDYNMVAASDFIMPFKENGREEIEIVTHIASNIQSPVNSGEKTGYLEILSGGERIGVVDILSQSDIMSVSNMRLKDSFYSTFMKVVRRVLI